MHGRGIAAFLQRHRRVGLDTPIFIYQLEASGRTAEAASAVLAALADGAFIGVTSVLTLTEVAVKPLQIGRPDTADAYDAIIGGFPNLIIAEPDRVTARTAAELRARHRLSLADAFQIASCLQLGATAFLTNDRRLRRISELEVVLLDDFATESR